MKDNRIHLKLAIPYSPDAQKIEAYFLRQDEKWHEMLYELQAFILSSNGQMQQWYKYNTPFFGIRKNICYLNVRANGSALDIGFVNGKILADLHPDLKPYFSGTELKTIRHFKLHPETWNEEKMLVLGDILERAIAYCFSRQKL